MRCRALLLNVVTLAQVVACGSTVTYRDVPGAGGGSSAAAGAATSAGGSTPFAGAAGSAEGGALGTAGASGAFTDGGAFVQGGVGGLGGSGGALDVGGLGGSAGIAGSAGGSAGGAGVAGASGGAGSGGVGGAAGTGGVAGASGSGGVAGASGAGGSPSTTTSVSVLQYHNDAARSGVYIDAKLTQAAVATLHADPSFASTTISSRVYAQPLYLAGIGGQPDTIIAAAEGNQVFALNAATGTVVWAKPPDPPVGAGVLPCGNIATTGFTLGVTGTPVIDGATRTLYYDAMQANTTVGGKHMVHAVAADTGVERAGWPVDVNAHAQYSFASTRGPVYAVFNSVLQNQRGALSLLGGNVIVPYGGHFGDCNGYHGWLVGISTTDPTQVTAWASRGVGGGVWAVSGAASDGTSLFFGTGNTKALATDLPNTTPVSWRDGETVYKLPSTLKTPSYNSTTDFFVPTNWQALDKVDADLGGTTPMIFDVAGATPSKLLMALGKDGYAYLLDRTNLGGLDATPLASLKATSAAIINGAVAYTTATASYVVFKNGGGGLGCPAGQTGDLTAIKISKGAPPTMSVAWCQGLVTNGSPAVSMSNSAGKDPIVWIIGTNNKLAGLDGDTGATLVTSTVMPTVQSIQTPMIANGRIFVASNTQLNAFTTN